MITDHPTDIKQLDINNKRAKGFVLFEEGKEYNYNGDVVKEYSTTEEFSDGNYHQRR